MAGGVEVGAERAMDEVERDSRECDNRSQYTQHCGDRSYTTCLSILLLELGL